MESQSWNWQVAPAELEYAFVKEMGAGVEGEVGDKETTNWFRLWKYIKCYVKRFGLCGDRCSLVNSCARHCFRPWKYSREQENRNSYSHGASAYFWGCFSVSFFETENQITLETVEETEGGISQLWVSQDWKRWGLNEVTTVKGERETETDIKACQRSNW